MVIGVHLEAGEHLEPGAFATVRAEMRANDPLGEDYPCVSSTWTMDIDRLDDSEYSSSSARRSTMSRNPHASVSPRRQVRQTGHDRQPMASSALAA